MIKSTTNKKRLSIIVPIYNVEPYVERCLRSLEDQDIPRTDYEIICINDGSPDNSREVVVRLQQEFDNIILIDQENQGVSMARNNGIDRAIGKYLLMVDPDDFVKANTFKNKLDDMDKYNLDIGYTGFTILDVALKEEYHYDPIIKQNKVCTGIDYKNIQMRGRYPIRDPHRLVAVFLKTSFINSNNLRYLANVPYLEDGELLTRVNCLAQRVLFLNDPFYLRTTRPGSATHSRLSHSEKGRNGFLKAAHNLLQFKTTVCRDEEQKAFMNQYIIHFTIRFITCHGKFSYFKHYSKIFDSLKKGPLKKLDTKGCYNIYLKMAKCYNFSIHIFYLFWLFFSIRKSLTIRHKKLLFI